MNKSVFYSSQRSVVPIHRPRRIEGLCRNHQTNNFGLKVHVRVAVSSDFARRAQTYPIYEVAVTAENSTNLKAPADGQFCIFALQVL